MRLHRIRLTDVRGVADRTVELPEVGVAILEGPNEVGKTTTAEAVDALFEFKDSSKSQQVRDLHTVDTDAGPRVELEFSSGAYRGVYVKQWGRGRTTRLALTSPRREQFGGDEAHERARRILDETVDPALWRALRVVQGDSLVPAAWHQVPSLGQALDRAAADLGEHGGDRGGADHEDLFTRVQTESARFFTVRTGQPTGPLAAATAAHKRAVAETVELRSRVADAQHDVEEAARVARELADVGEREGRLSDVLKQARDDAARLQRLRDTLDRSTAGRASLVSEVEATRREHHERSRAVDEVADRQQTMTSLRPAVAAVRQRVDAACTHHGSRAAAVATARDARDRARRRLRVADGQRTAARHRSDLEQLAGRLAAASAQRERLAEADAVLEQSRVDDSLLRRLEDAASALWQAQRSRELAAPTMTVERLGEHEVHLDDDPLPADGGSAGGAGVEMCVTGARSVEVVGVVRVVVRPGSGADDLDADVERARAACSELLDAAGVPSLDEARDEAERRRGAVRERELAQAALEQHLGTETWQALCDRVTALSAHVRASGEPPASDDDGEGASVAQREDAVLLGSAAVMELDRAYGEANRLLEEAEAALGRSERLRDVAAETLTRERAELTQLGERLATHEHEYERLAERLDRARRDRSDATLECAALDAQRRLGELDQQLSVRAAEVEAADPEGVRLALANAEALERRLSAERQELQSRADQVRGRLSSVESLGLFDRVVEAEAVLDTAARELASVQRQARAARLLARTMAARRTEARNRYIAPYRCAVQRLGRFVFGDDFEVDVDPDLRVVSRTLGGRTVPVGSLSGGAREQLALVERLACAELVGAAEGVPVVIDDALGWSDPERLQRMGAVLSAAARHSQVIVLTCQPDRYQYVGEATVVRLWP